MGYAPSALPCPVRWRPRSNWRAVQTRPELPKRETTPGNKTKLPGLNRKLRSPVDEVHQLPWLLRLDPLRLFHNLCPGKTRALLPGLVRRPPPVLVRRDHPRQDFVYRFEVRAPPSVHVHGTCQPSRRASGRGSNTIPGECFSVSRTSEAWDSVNIVKSGRSLGATGYQPFQGRRDQNRRTRGGD